MIADQKGSGGTGSYSLAKQGAGTLTLSGANTYSGGTTVTGGLLDFNALTAVGSGKVTLNGGGLQWAPGTSSDVSPRLNALGSNGGTFDTNANNVTLASAISGTGGLAKQGTGTLTVSGNNGYTGTTDVQQGSLAVTGTVSGPVAVESGATLAVTGTVDGLVTVQPGGTLSCGGGTLNGGVTNNGGAATSVPGAPTAVSAAPGVGQATVSFTPGAANCSPVSSYTVTASPGGAHASGSASPITVTGLSDATSYTFTVTASNPIGTGSASAASNAAETVGAPTASISTPTAGAIYTVGQPVDSSFSCTESTGGPGISSCTDQNAHASGAAIDTSTAGSHTLTVTATSGDGQAGTASTSYTVTAPTATILASTTNPSAIGQQVTYTATVSPMPDGGSIAFSDGASMISGCATVAVQTLTGQATCRVAYHSSESHAIRATYSGDADFTGSQSTLLDQLVATATGANRLSLSGRPSSNGNRVSDKLSCAASPPQPCQVTETLTSIETTQRGQPIAVSATHAKHKQRTVVLATKTVTIKPGRRVTMTVTLNGTGRKLLKRFRKLPVKLTVALTVSGKHVTVATRTLRLRPASKRHHRH